MKEQVKDIVICPEILKCGYTHRCSHASEHQKSDELCHQFAYCPCPCRQPKGEKPSVLTSDQVHREWRKRSRQLPPYGAEMHRETQRDADTAYYEPIIQQAKAEVAREIDMLLCILVRDVASKSIEAGVLLVEQLIPVMQSLKDRFLKEKTK